MLSKSAKHHAPRWAALLGLASLAIADLSTGALGRGESTAGAVVRGIDGRVIPIVPSKGGATAVVFYSTEMPDLQRI